MKISIPYGKKSLEVILPASRLLGVLENKRARGESVKKLVSRALDNPLAGAKPKDLVAGHNSILVVVPDATRSSHLKDVLPLLLKRIGAPRRRIDIIVATGLHKKHDRSQLRGLLGTSLVKNHSIICHDQDKKSLVRLGRTKRGVPVTLNKRVRQYGCIISVGVIEPHLYAGYSGGAKTVAIGLAGRETIDATHSVRFLDHSGTCIGSVRGNPFQETLWDIVAKAHVDFSVNIVNDAAGCALKAFAGATRDVFDVGVAFSKKIFEVMAPGTADVVICGVGHPKDVNFYQASRAINYILSNDKPVLKKGGVLIVAAQLEDGIGRSAAERLFYDCLRGMRSPRAFIARMQEHGCVAGEHRAYMVAKALLDHAILFVTARQSAWMRGLLIPIFRRVEDALAHADGIAGSGAKIYVIPKALSTIARSTSSYLNFKEL